MADLVFKQDKGLQQNLPLRLAHGVEDARKVRLAVFQQLDLVVALPAVIEITRFRFIRRLVGGDVFYRNVHNSISTDSGTWSDKCDHGRVVSTLGLRMFKLRT